VVTGRMIMMFKLAFLLFSVKSVLTESTDSPTSLGKIKPYDIISTAEVKQTSSKLFATCDQYATSGMELSIRD
jgi:hypothetical protein